MASKLQPWGQIQLTSAYVNNVLLERNARICLRVIYGYFYATKAEFGSCDRDPMTHKTSFLLSIYFFFFWERLYVTYLFSSLGTELFRFYIFLCVSFHKLYF